MAQFSRQQRSKLARKGDALPDGSFPIRNNSDLQNAKQAVGRSKNPAAARAFINQRAEELGEPPIGASHAKKKKHVAMLAARLKGK